MKQMIALIFLSVFFTGCGSSKSNSERSGEAPYENADVVANPNRHNVLVIDDGFDLNHPVFRNKVVARYRLRCSESTGPVIEAQDNYESQKRALISYLSYEESDCILSPRLPFQPSRALEGIQHKRDEWNQALKSKTVSETYKGREWEAESIFQILSDRGRYHGTNTAGLIAYNNDRVNLFVLQLELASPQSINTDNTSASCPRQVDIDVTTKLYSDPEVIEAFASAPLPTISSQDAAIDQLIKKHKISLVNKSYGMLPLDAIQRSLEANHCSVNFAPLFAARARLLDARRERFPEPKDAPLVFQAAGNEGLSINSLEQSWDCTLKDDNTILVGGVNYEFERATWSNFGSCVEMYAVGDRVITPAPLEFLNIASGTSFSSPMALRYATMITSPGASSSEIRSAILTDLDSDKNLSDSHFPHELVYQVPHAITSYGVTRNASSELDVFKPRRIDRKRIPKLLRHLFK